MKTSIFAALFLAAAAIASDNASSMPNTDSWRANFDGTCTKMLSAIGAINIGAAAQDISWWQLSRGWPNCRPIEKLGVRSPQDLLRMQDGKGALFSADVIGYSLALLQSRDHLGWYFVRGKSECEAALKNMNKTGALPGRR